MHLPKICAHRGYQQLVTASRRDGSIELSVEYNCN